MYTIYALIDPRDWSVHYIGMTDNVYTRFQQHIKQQSNNEQKNVWLQSLKDVDVMVFMKTLETTDTIERAMQREAYWIQHYLQLGMPLTNRYTPLPLSTPTIIATKISPKSSNKATLVRKALKRNPGMRPTDIARKTGVSRSYVSEIISQLRKEG